MTFREEKNLARGRLHDRLKASARCFAGAPDEESEVVTARVHSRLIRTGDLPETGLPFAEREEIDPRLVFIIDEHRPLRNNVYSLGGSEAYQVVRVEPPDGISITAVCNRLSEAEADRWPSP